MSATVNRTPKSGRQSLFYQDLATPVSSRRSGGKLTSPRQAAAVTALWRESITNSELPPPPLFTLEDRTDFSPESGNLEYPLSPGGKSDPTTPVRSLARNISSPKSKSEVSTSYARTGKLPQVQSQKSPVLALSWWSSAKSGDTEHDDKGKPSVDVTARSDALIPFSLSREDAKSRRENSLPTENMDGEEWVTVYGFLPANTNLVLREFERCGLIVKHIPGPRESNWMHILYQNPNDAQKALRKNGMEINTTLIVGVKPINPMIRRILSEKLIHQEFMPLPPGTASTLNSESKSFKVAPYPHYIQNSGSAARHSSAIMATPSKSVVSKVIDFIFGV